MAHHQGESPSGDSPSKPIGSSQHADNPSAPHKLSSRITSFQDISDLSNFHNGFSPTGTPEPGPPASVKSPMWSNPFPPRGYEPVAAATADDPPRPPKRPVSGLRERSYTTDSLPDTIPEGRESIDLALLPAAAPMGTTDEPAQDTVRRGRNGETVPADWANSLGPLSGHDQTFMRVLQEQEKAGELTGGLGAGFKPGTTIREADLLARSPTVERAPSRSFSVRKRGAGLSRTATRKALAQSEADRRGQPIEVIIEEDEAGTPENSSRVDISVMDGPEFDFSDFSWKLNGASFPPPKKKEKKQRTETYFPQPDWKPFSMRQPYLVLLIVLSMTLAGIGEVLYQVSARNPLVKFNKPQEINPGVYFAIKFLPTLFAVTYGVLWQITGSEVQRLEAYYQLSREHGATAGRSLNVDYIGQFNFLRPFMAFQLRHYAVAVSSVASLLAVSLVPTLSAASIVLTPDQAERQRDPTVEKHISIDPVWSRFLTVTLLIIAILGCILFYQLSSRRSGLLADVKGIAGVAAMANVSHILMDFKGMDVATHQGIHHKLKNRRYVLRNSSLAPHEQPLSHPGEDDRSEPHHLSRNPHPLMLRPEGSIPFIAGIGLFTIAMPVFLFTPAGVLTDRAPWIPTALAVSIKLAWGAVDTNVRMMEPFYILSRRRAPPRTLALDYGAVPFAWVALRALLNGHVLVFLVGFGTVMTEILTVLVTSLANVEGRGFIQQQQQQQREAAAATPGHAADDATFDPGQETAPSFWISLALATFILCYMGAVATAVFLRRRHAFLPRQPSTIASVLAFIHQSRMLYDFVGTEKLGNGDMVRTLEGIRAAGGRGGGGKTYGLGWFEGRDGDTHCGVDEEELVCGYRHGVDYSRANRPWVEEPHEWL